MPDNNENLKHTTFIAACHEFFGRLPGETLQEFNKELKALTVDDRAEMIQLFRSIGYDATKQS